MHPPENSLVRVSYLELRRAPSAPPAHIGTERIAREPLTRADYLALYRCVGDAVHWDQRLKLSAAQLDALLGADRLKIYVLRSPAGEALGFCEFDHGSYPQIELKNFGIVPQAQGRGLGLWLLCTALGLEWQSQPQRIWLHTDTWDHPAAIPTYQRAGFCIYAVRDEVAASL